MVICGGSALRVDVLMPGRRWQLDQGNWPVQRVQPSHSRRHRPFFS